MESNTRDAKAERLAEEELQALNWTTDELRGRRKSDPQKIRIAARLRRETTMTFEWDRKPVVHGRGYQWFSFASGKLEIAK